MFYCRLWFIKYCPKTIFLIFIVIFRSKYYLLFHNIVINTWNIYIYTYIVILSNSIFIRQKFHSSLHQYYFSNLFLVMCKKIQVIQGIKNK